MEVVLKKRDGWWIADGGLDQYAVVTPEKEEAVVVLKWAKTWWPDARIGIESASLGPATREAFGPVVWMRRK